MPVVKTRRIVAGCMTGTSIDGIDAALVALEGEGLSVRAEFLRGVSGSLEGMAEPLRRFAMGEAQPAGEIAEMAARLGRRHVEILKELLGREQPDLIALHGQTVFHRPPLSWQLLNPWPVAHQWKTKVIFDLRSANLASGGEGAPITPLADFILFRDCAKARVIINFGGFINYTYLPKEPAGADHKIWVQGIQGGDISPCNQLLDGITRLLLGLPYDEGGALALTGRIDPGASADLRSRLETSSERPKSLGSGDEGAAWIERHSGRIAVQDLLKTACSVVAENLADKLGGLGEYDLIAAGGGVKNRALINEVERSTGRKIGQSDSLGIPSQYREAVSIAVLGDLASNGVDITLSNVTGVSTELQHGCRIGRGWY